MQKDSIKLSQQLLDKTKELEAKARQAPLDTVEEQLCPNCQNSLEES